MLSVVALVRFFCKPWRVVEAELIAFAGGHTVLSIPAREHHRRRAQTDHSSESEIPALYLTKNRLQQVATGT